ncbi:unnamed protein product [Allacma fusca]|uniref:Uncharacterized protein n=1 Tax=Allacma fusca TaxID=39272 RepID=A0A8J2PJL6_9HEXA|nr:unnamed protein product [Allacma fusca]
MIWSSIYYRNFSLRDLFLNLGRTNLQQIIQWTLQWNRSIRAILGGQQVIPPESNFLDFQFGKVFCRGDFVFEPLR